MAEESILLRMREVGARAIQRAAQATGRSIRGMGSEVRRSGLAGRMALRSYTSLGGGLMAVSRGAMAVGAGLGVAGVAAARWGLQYNAAVETAVNRFKLFTSGQAEAQRLFEQMRALNKESVYGLPEITNAAAYLGNAGVEARKLDKYMLGVANAASAAGGGSERLKRVSTAIGQMATNGIVAREEMNQLNEAGVATGFLRKSLKLTSKEWRNLGEQGISSNKVIGLLMERWTSGKMAKAAVAQTRTFSGQIAMLKDQAQAIAGGVTGPLFDALRKDVLPDINRVAAAVGRIWDREDLDWGSKIQLSWDLIVRRATPMVNSLVSGFKRAGIAEKIGDAAEAASPYISQGLSAAFAAAAPVAARAFIAGFRAAPGWAKLLTAAFLMTKIRGAMRSLGGQACGPFSNAVNPCVAGKMTASAGKGGRLAMAATMIGRMMGPLAGAAMAAALIQALSSETPGLAAESGNPETGRRRHRIQPGDPTAQEIINRRGQRSGRVAPNSGGAFGGGVRPIAPLPGRGASVPPIVVPVTVTADGKPIGRTVARAGQRKKATK
jgi:tape measure domain-containing protein